MATQPRGGSRTRGPILIVDYDPAWPGRFAGERDAIFRTCGASTFAALEHVGSTSVPGLAGKPIIDIMGGLHSLADAANLTELLARIGYEYVPEYERAGPSGGLPERRYFRRRENGEESVHLHVVETSSAFWERHLLFRDHLRRHPGTAREYERLKRNLAEMHGTDFAGYTAGKSSFIESVQAEARRHNAAGG